MNRCDKLFTASYTIVGIIGKVLSSRLTFKRSNVELDPILVGLSKIRNNMGIPNLKRSETDNAADDGNLCKNKFQIFKKMQLSASLQTIT